MGTRGHLAYLLKGDNQATAESPLSHQSLLPI